jgi:bifunctional UDP-N-acetylglucosamine pyrophosphorylase/glucosamine-1-phosphate N-acetyltransferase
MRVYVTAKERKKRMTGLEILERQARARREILARHIENGVHIPCEDGVMIDEETTIGTGSTILPGCVLTRCAIGADVTLDHVHAADVMIGRGVTIGPFVRLRPGTVIGDDVKIGNFVEIKNASLGTGTKVAHLSYIGDADFGAGINVGCGLAVANYDGKKKHRTRVGDGAFLGCHTSLVAPVNVGDGAYVAAGSVITQDVPPDTLAIARTRQVHKERKK